MQERQSPRSGPPAVVNPQLARASTARFAAAAGAFALSLFVMGCPQPADLENPDGFAGAPGSSAAGTGTAGGSGGSGTAGTGNNMSACETACMSAIINATGTGCKACHGKTIKLSGTLDFETPGYTARLKDQPAEHAGVQAGAQCPTGDKFINSAMPAESWLLKKIKNMQGTCGTVMPSTGALPAADQTCVETYVNCVATGQGAPAGGGGTGGAAAGSGGTGGA